MKTVSMTSRQQAEILGVLFAEYEILTNEQASIIRQQMDKPSFFYNGGKDTLWSFYNHATVALQQSHPRTWMEDQRMLHWFISNEFNLGQVLVASITPAVEITVPMVDPLNAIPNQTNILDQIAELERVQYPLTPDDTFQTEPAPEPTEEEVAEANEIWGITEEEVSTTLPDVIQFTDAAGNTFEAPVVEEVLETAPQRVKFAVDNTEEEPVTSTEFDFDDFKFEEEDGDDKSLPDFFL
jgi:hypothetical protein